MMIPVITVKLAVKFDHGLQLVLSMPRLKPLAPELESHVREIAMAHKYKQANGKTVAVIEAEIRRFLYVEQAKGNLRETPERWEWTP